VELIKKYKIDDNFIGIFENFFSEEVLENYKRYFRECEKHGLVFLREDEHLRKDTAITALTNKNDEKLVKKISELKVPYDNQEFIETFYRDIFPLYLKKYTHFKDVQQHTIYSLKIQKTKPAEGYHTWHAENGDPSNCRRIFAFTLYLNDVAEGGETEFLYQKCRVKPMKNRFVLWPAAITHVHRGNPPLTNNKYILTGWVEYR
jgi:hypothetical protein